MQNIISELHRIRGRSRAMLILQRMFVLLAWSAGVIVVLVAIDWLLRLPAAIRLLMLIGGLGVLSFFIWSYLRVALRFAPSLTQLALRVEQALPSLSGRLASSVEFASAGVDASNPLAARSVRDTEQRLLGTRIASVLDPRRTWRDVGVSGAVLGLVALLAATSPSSAQIGVSRLFAPYGAARWPARTGVESRMDDVLMYGRVHPRGQALPLRAVVTRGADDQDVGAAYRLLVDGRWEDWERVVLTHQGEGVHERLVDTSAEAIELYFTTVDARTDTERIELAPPPEVRRAILDVTPPAYASGRLAPQSLEMGTGLDSRATTEDALLLGSDLIFTLHLNKPLPVPDRASREQWLRNTLGWFDGELPAFRVDDNDNTRWILRWRLSQTRTLPLDLVDEHGLANSEPISFRIAAVADAPPSVTITEPQSDRVVLPTALVELTAEASDDVAVARLSLEARLAEGRAEPADAVVWSQSATVDAPEGLLDAAIDLAALEVREGDVVWVTGVGEDHFELDGQRHEAARSAPRRLRVISELDFATQLRQQLGAVRQNAIRIETLQGELQDDIVDDGVQPGVNRAQAQITERIATQREALDDIERQMRTNRLQDDQLESLLRQSQDLLDFAGRASTQATRQIEQRQTEAAAAEARGAGAQAGRQPAAPGGEPRENEPAGADEDEGDDDVRPMDDEDAEPREASPPDRPIVESQQQVRDELADLIELLDRDEDTWVITRQLEQLIEQQERLRSDTQRLGQRTVGQSPQEMTADDRAELERIVEEQNALTDEARQLIESARERAEALEDVDPRAAEGLRSAAETAEQRELDRDMQTASERAEQNQMQSAAAAQQRASDTLQRMQEEMERRERARAQELVRQLASLIQSIERLIVLQEDELTALARAQAADEYTGRDRAMIRLNQNTQAVEVEARSAGQEARRIARTLDRAADAQGAAVTALRANPIDDAAAQEAENHSLDLLREAKELAEELQQQTQEQETRRRREELMAAYREYAERQVVIRESAVELAARPELSRRELVEVRRLGSRQEGIGSGLRELRDITGELADAAVFSRVHDWIDEWSQQASDELLQGRVDVNVTDRQQLIADSLGRLIEALEELLAPPNEFERGSGGEDGGQQQGGQGQQPEPLIPPVAQLRLLQGIQQQIYEQTRRMDERSDLSDATTRARLREIGRHQRELMDLGQQMINELQGSGGLPTPPDDPPAPDQPEADE